MIDNLKEHGDLAKLLDVMEELYNVNDLDALLDQVLLQARRLTNADAGSIYIIVDNVLNFSYVHNDTLFGAHDSRKHLYSSQTLPIDEHSLAGYVALSGEALILDDAYNIPPTMPFTFNRSFDEQSGYRTRSILASPLKTSRGKVAGVVELINALGDHKEVIAFSDKDRLIVSYFAGNAGAAIERARLTREIIVRMIKMCEMRDPEETGPHVHRVGAYSAEIYHRWSLNRGLPPEEIRSNKDLMRIAAMLHDIGKVAISDLILKKPGGLDNDEFVTMKLHTIHGARLFQYPASDLDVMAAEIALNHHEKWDGSGYPGKIDNIFSPQVSLGQGKRGEEIPLSARIVALADVYDALGSKRSYKEPLPEDQTLEFIEGQAGKHFDPEVVQAFMEIHEVILAIKEKYQEDQSFCLLCP